MIFGSVLRLMVKKEICSDRNWRETFPGTALWRVHSTHSVISLFSYSTGETLLEKKVPEIFGSMLMPMVKREIASDKNWKEAFYKTALWYVYSSHIHKVLFTLRSLEALSWMNPWRDIREHFQDYVEKGNIFRWKLEKSFLWICFLLCLFISHR